MRVILVWLLITNYLLIDCTDTFYRQACSFIYHILFIILNEENKIRKTNKAIENMPIDNCTTGRTIKQAIVCTPYKHIYFNLICFNESKMDLVFE